MSNVLCVIPARGGSKGLPRKNIRLLRGRPLVAYSINLALACGCFDEVMVSTDDPEIAAVSRECGANVPFMRPAELSDDHASLTDVVAHVLDEYARRGYQPQVIGSMLPTSPFRSVNLVRKLTMSCLRGGRRCATTVRRVEAPAIYASAEGGAACRRVRDVNRVWPGAYYRNYGVYQARRLVSHLPSEQHGIHLLEHPAEWLDIDAYEDFALAEKILENNLYDFGYEL